MDGGLMVQKILPAEIITQNAAFAVVMFLGTGAMRISTTAPTAGRVWMEVKIVRLVDLDAVIDHLEVEWGYEGIREDLYSLPVVDAVPVVRCKDCKHWQRHTGVVDSPNGHCFALETCTNGMEFCSYGEYQTNTGGDGNVSD